MVVLVIKCFYHGSEHERDTVALMQCGHEAQSQCTFCVLLLVLVAFDRWLQAGSGALVLK